jgi:ribonucleoside-diphosphate reductase alpha chain
MSLTESHSTQANVQTFTIVKRNGHLVTFKPERILRAIESAFRDTKKIDANSQIPSEIYEQVKDVYDKVLEHIYASANANTTITVEAIQDLVEVKLMELEQHDVARNYIIYRDQRKAEREEKKPNIDIVRSGHSGKTAHFNPIKIASTFDTIFQNHSDLPEHERVAHVNMLTQKIVAKAIQVAETPGALTTNFIGDEVERQLMQEGFFDVAKSYILSRAKRKQPEVTPSEEDMHTPTEKELATVHAKDGRTYKLYKKQLKKKFAYACKDLEIEAKADELLDTSIANFYEGIREREVDNSNVMAARSRIEKDPAYSKVAARLLLDIVYREAMDCEATDRSLGKKHKAYFKEYFAKAVKLERLSPKLLDYDLEKLADAIDLDRDLSFEYLGLQTLYDRYFIHEEERRIETPQIFWMRVAMGLALNEDKKEERAIEFYDMLSTFRYLSSTPTLFNSGTIRSQLSSCFLSTVQDDLEGIFHIISDDAKLSKWAGGLGNDWTNVRATGARIKGTNGKSQGVIPFMKVANDTAVAVNQGGKRKGAMCAYLETWHLDVEDFLELRKNTGDERRRTHDMNTANWIPDLFMERLVENGSWTLFNPSDVSDLHDLYGKAFKKRYEEYEKMTQTGEIKLFKTMQAQDLWRKMLSMLFETGHPWITFKDPSNIRSPQDHKGVVHSSNLCTEILLNTNKEETAVCNLGSVNLAAHMKDGAIDVEMLKQTVTTAIRMLDNVIDINFYPIPETKNANSQHRPIGLGLMGFQDALYLKGISYASPEAIEFADESMELISYYAILASSELAKERGAYATYKGSKWDRGLLPIDTVPLVAKERGEKHYNVDTKMRLDWAPVRASIKANGMRNSNTMAIAPTATIANIAGVTASIEPTYKHLFVKSNLSGEFTVPNPHLTKLLKEKGLWDEEMIDDLKYFDGSLQEIERVPEEVKQIYPTAFEVEPDWMIECASRRQKWIDMGQSLNLYLNEPSGKKMDKMYRFAWTKGLKTTYYCRTLAATQVEKSTTDVNKRGLQPRWMKSQSASSRVQVERDSAPKVPVCNLEEGCESCQ